MCVFSKNSNQLLAASDKDQCSWNPRPSGTPVGHSQNQTEQIGHGKYRFAGTATSCSQEIGRNWQG